MENYEDALVASGSSIKGAALWTSRTVKDPIHDQIGLSPRSWMFVDTKQFQRLRQIKQLGTSYYVWAGASHNRFEHCIGVAYLARLMASHLQKHQPELGITDRDVQCVEIAGLCHDLGHGPWSHVWDNLFIPKALPGSEWKHEDGSVLMFDYLVEDNDISLEARDADFIKALISGDHEKCPDEKPFLFDIVANKRNGLDVDKFDYISRDSHMIGDGVKIALPRIIKSARVLDDQICYDIKDANQLYDICSTRFKLHKMVYNHKAAKAIEYMIIDGLLAADPHVKIAERVFQKEKYLYLTDNIMNIIEASDDEELAPARAIFERIRNRDLYKMVDFKSIPWRDRMLFKEYITPQTILEATKKHPDADFLNISGLTVDDIIVDFSTMHYGMGAKNPLDCVKFYSKSMPNRSDNAGLGDYSTLRPECHAEVLLRIYTKKKEYFGIIQAGYRQCLKQYPGSELVGSDYAPTPLFPIAELPSATTTNSLDLEFSTTPTAPRAFSRHSSAITLSSVGSMFADNTFTTVPTSFVPSSPSRENRRARRVVEGAGVGASQGSAVVSGRGGTDSRSFSRSASLSVLESRTSGLRGSGHFSLGRQQGVESVQVPPVSESKGMSDEVVIPGYL